MATIDLTSGETTLTPSRWSSVKTPYLVEVELDFAAAVTEKGSALAADDIIEVMEIPAEHIILAAGFEVTEAHAGTSTDTDFDLGVTGIDVDAFVDGFDFDGASVGDYSVATASAPIVIGGTADTLDLEIQAMTGTTTGGKLRVWALLLDIGDKNAPGIAALGS